MPGILHEAILLRTMLWKQSFSLDAFIQRIGKPTKKFNWEERGKKRKEKDGKQDRGRRKRRRGR